MGNTVRSCLALSLTSIVIVATTAWADRPTKQECREACNEFTAEFVGSSDQSVSLNRKQRGVVANSIRQVAKQCIRLCGFGVVDIDTLAQLVASLREPQGGGEQNSIGSLRPPSFRPTAKPVSAIPQATATPIASPRPVTTVPPVATMTPMPQVTSAPYPTVAGTVAPEVTSAPYPTVAVTVAPELTVIAEPTSPYVYPPGYV
jgi:hypothetical protein